MANITMADFQSEMTKAVVAIYKERNQPTGFLRSFFPTKTSATRFVSIQVQRGFEKIAVDVMRGSDGNRNTFSSSTEKVIEPAGYKEYFDATGLNSYEKLYTGVGVDSALFSQYVEEVFEKSMELRSKIERAYELQCATVLLDGKVNLQAASNIDFKRKTASIVDLGSGEYFAAANANPFKSFENAAKWIRQNGRSGAVEFNAILGETALTDLYANTKFLARQDLTSFRLDSVSKPQRNAEGGVYHGTISAGAYIINLWTYPQYYDNESGTSTSYIDPKRVVVIASDAQNVLAFGAPPQLIGSGVTPIRTDYRIENFVDEKRKTDEYVIDSYGIAVPVSIDKIYTFKAVTG